MDWARGQGRDERGNRQGGFGGCYNSTATCYWKVRRERGRNKAGVGWEGVRFWGDRGKEKREEKRSYHNSFVEELDG